MNGGGACAKSFLHLFRLTIYGACIQKGSFFDWIRLLMVLRVLCAHIYALVYELWSVECVCVCVAKGLYHSSHSVLYCVFFFDWFFPLSLFLYVSLYSSSFLSSYHHAYFVSVESPNRLVLFCCMRACNVIPSSKIEILELFENCAKNKREIEKWLTFSMHTHFFCVSLKIP